MDSLFYTRHACACLYSLVSAEINILSAEQDKIRILIADDRVLIREGLKRILKNVPDMMVAFEARNSEEAVSQSQQEEIDVVVLDISLSGESGLNVLKEIQKGRPNLPIIILSANAEDQIAARSLKAGAAGYLTTECAADELMHAIRRVVEGRKYVSTSLSERLASQLESDAGKPLHESLSNREFQVLCMIATGKKAKDIAQELSLSVNTINTYRTRIMGKMKMTKDAELIRYALQNRLVE